MTRIIIKEEIKMKNLIIFIETAILSAIAGSAITLAAYTFALKSEGYEAHFHKMKH